MGVDFQANRRDEEGKARSRRACGHPKKSGLDPGSSGGPSALSHHHFPPGRTWAAQCPQGQNRQTGGRQRPGRMMTNMGRAVAIAGTQWCPFPSASALL